jgi:glycosyltransferase involved in cell wall biosynthesis
MMEAMALGVPIMITDVGCVRHVMTDGQDGFVVASDDLAAMTQRLRELMSSADLRSRFATAASGKAIEFRQETMVAKTLAAYEDSHRD